MTDSGSTPRRARAASPRSSACPRCGSARRAFADRWRSRARPEPGPPFGSPCRWPRRRPREERRFILPPMRILIADDHALFRDGLRSLLTAQGHEVVGEAKNGREAVAMARTVAPEMILMDIPMPELG